MTRTIRLTAVPVLLGVMLFPGIGAASAAPVSVVRGGDVIATIATGPRPQDVVVSPDGRFAYVTTFDDGLITKIDLSDFTVVGQTSVGPSAGAVISTVNGIVVASETGSTVNTLDPDTLAPIGGFNTEGTDPIALTSSADGTITVFAAAQRGAIGIIDDANQYFSFVEIGGKPWGVDLFAGDTRAIVADQTNARVVIATLGTGGESPVVIANVPVGGRPSYLAVAPDESVAYVANADRGAVDVVDLSTLTVTASYAVGGKPWGVAVSSDGKYLYIPDNSGGTVIAVDAATGRVLSTTPTGTHPDFVAVSPDGTQVFVPNSGSNTLTVVQGYSTPPSTADSGTDQGEGDGLGTSGDSGTASSGGGIDPVGIVAISVGGVAVLGGVGWLVYFLVHGGAGAAAAAAAASGAGVAVAGAGAGAGAGAVVAAPPPGRVVAPLPDLEGARTRPEIDPDATPEQLAEYATRAEYRPAVAAHPNAYPDLLIWLGSLGEPDVDAALRARR